ncbi:hypothetical protein GCG54_00007471 [Colletotrichum gloeosporioides]|uniref:LysM domain-containing protein n=1 Tax=Colletotrichum gloeosporioides TaxID=474922 RepID=A0A8H4FMH8_COLGL|nr:uncharacterized protein GCG54_00007471 [Colletotrichum gloeosporioides]KAF3807738.1 hypothetical protein GCG54_00007471 [Colletotrichum gloeosporioides]
MHSTFFFLALLTSKLSLAADECQPWTWKRDVEAAGDIVCRYDATTSSTVNYYTCTEISLQYSISVEKFFLLNPDLDRDCETIKPNTTYCVRGYVMPLVTEDGFCGSSHDNTTCHFTDTPCCNSETWKCGDTSEDCRPGTCHNSFGTCDELGYSTDGKCGTNNDDLKCTGKWGECCNNDGLCGNGTDFCSSGVCQSGNCAIDAVTPPPVSSPLPWITGTTPDGTCGGAFGYTCDIVFGTCCSSRGICGVLEEHCGTGW